MQTVGLAFHVGVPACLSCLRHYDISNLAHCIRRGHCGNEGHFARWTPFLCLHYLAETV